MSKREDDRRNQSMCASAYAGGFRAGRCITLSEYCQVYEDYMTGCQWYSDPRGQERIIEIYKHFPPKRLLHRDVRLHGYVQQDARRREGGAGNHPEDGREPAEVPLRPVHASQVA